MRFRHWAWRREGHDAREEKSLKVSFGDLFLEYGFWYKRGTFGLSFDMTAASIKRVGKSDVSLFPRKRLNPVPKRGSRQ